MQILIVYRDTLSQRKDDVYRFHNNIWFSLLPSQTESLLKPILYKQAHKFKKKESVLQKKDDTFKEKKKEKCCIYAKSKMK